MTIEGESFFFSISVKYFHDNTEQIPVISISISPKSFASGIRHSSIMIHTIVKRFKVTFTLNHSNDLHIFKLPTNTLKTCFSLLFILFKEKQ